jgi:hypothetical protein
MNNDVMRRGAHAAGGLRSSGDLAADPLSQDRQGRVEHAAQLHRRESSASIFGWCTSG